MTTHALKAALCITLWAATPLLAAEPPAFNKRGDILISDQFNNRVIEVSRGGKIVWSFGSNRPKLCNPGPGAIIAPNSAERLANGDTLMPGTGNGSCADNRVIVIDVNGDIVFQYGQAGVTGSGPEELNVPVFAIQTPDGNYLITDQGNNRIIEVDPWGDLLYQYGPTSGKGALNSPNSALLLDNGDILIADENNSRVLEINPSSNNQIVFDYKRGLNTVGFASRLPNGDTLIADSGNNRIVEINTTQKIVFKYRTNLGTGSNPNPNPTGALRLKDGTTLIADQFNDRVIIVSPSKKLLFQYGTTNVAGNKKNQLNAPYSAMSIGDYTGFTVPPGE